MKTIQILLFTVLLLTSKITAAPAVEKLETPQYRHNLILIITLPASPNAEEIRIPWTIVKNGETLQYSENKEGIGIALTVADISKNSVDINYSIFRNNGPEIVSLFQISSYAEFKFDKPQTISINKTQAVSLTLGSK